MRVFALGDLHLSFEVDKPMDVFGGRWKNYEAQIKTNWEKTVTEEDVVIIPGDVSWATYLKQAKEDFLFIESLPGRKIIGKGNHDYWWETVRKMTNFLHEIGCYSMEFLYNNAIELDYCELVGTKGYGQEEKDGKIINREIERFKISLQKANSHKKKIAVFHYPPTHSDQLMSLLKEYNIEKTIYGHIHGEQTKNLKINEQMILVSSDYCHFTPTLICSE